MKKIYDNKRNRKDGGLGDATTQEKADAGLGYTYSSNGLFHTAIPLRTLSYKSAPNEQVISQAGSEECQARMVATALPAKERVLHKLTTHFLLTPQEYI